MCEMAQTALEAEIREHALRIQELEEENRNLKDKLDSVTGLLLIEKEETARLNKAVAEQAVEMTEVRCLLVQIGHLGQCPLCTHLMHEEMLLTQMGIGCLQYPGKSADDVSIEPCQLVDYLKFASPQLLNALCNLLV